MASGVPCLVANAIGSSSLVVEGENGRLARSGDVDDFTKKLEHMISDPTALHNMGRRSRELALNYQWNHINEALVTDYRTVVSNVQADLN